MTAFGILNFLAWFLELCVPSYALRLVRRFGAHQVGSFVVVSFVSLALLHLFNPMKPGMGSGLALSFVYAGASVLLLIGMGHVETVCQQRQRIQLEEQQLRTKLDSEARQKADDLVKIRQELAQEIVRLQQQVEALTASERQYRLLFANHPHPMWMFDLRSGRVLAGNDSALNLYGFSQKEFTGLTAKDLMSREAAKAFVVDFAKPCSTLEGRGIWRHRRKDRTPIDVEIIAVDLRFGDCPARLMMAEDIAPRVRRETELCELQRMRILRRVAEGVAHHFGQILTVVEGQAGVLRAGREGTAEADHLQQVLSEARRGSALIRQLLAVGACEGIQPEPIDLNSLIQKHEGLMRRLIGERIALEFHLGEALAPVLADARVLEHILVNLFLNAREALPQGGTIAIHTEAAWLDPHQKQHQTNANIKPGHFVHLTVRDNGSGMTAEVQERLFEPFFTTREDEKAMGLGLATVYGAVKQHGGWIEFESEPQRGTEFSVFLPVAQLPKQDRIATEPTVAPSTGETILLVEPHDRIRDLARHILQRNGYQVIEADSPATAALLMESQAKNIHLLLTDLSFPGGGSGRELAGRLLEMNSQLKVVYATAPLGADDDETALLQEAKLLLKPYTPDRLVQTIGSSLSNPIPHKVRTPA